MTPPDVDAGHVLPAALIHDLRNPLSQIIGYTELLMEEAQERGDEKSIPYLTKVRAAGYLLVGMIDDNFHSVRVLSDAAEILASRKEPAGAPPGAGAAEAAAH